MTFRNALGSCTVVLALALLAGPSGLSAQENVRLSGARIAIYNLAGEVEIVRGGGSDVVVTISRGGDDAERLTVETGRIDGRETMRVIYPDDEVVYREMGRGSSTDVRVRDDGTFGGGDRVRVRGSGGGMEAWADLRIQVPAGTDLAVYLAAGRIHAAEVDGNLRLDTHSGAVDARDIAGDLTVDTGSGSVEVSGVDGNVSVDTGSGRVTVDDARGREMEVDTGSGSVRGSGLSFDRVSVDTGSGSVELQQVAARDVMVDTGSGSVELDLTTDVDQLEVDTGSGSVTVRVPDGFGAEVELDTGSGGIDLDVDLTQARVRRNHATGLIGDGNGTVKLDTGSGGIRLVRR